MNSNKKSKLTLLAYLMLAAALGLIGGCSSTSRADDEHAHGKEGHSEDEHEEEGHSEDERDKGEEAHDEHDKEGHSEDEHGEEAHGEHEDVHEGEEQLVRLTPADMKEFGIELQTAGSGSMDQYVELPGEIVLNADRLAHVPPRLPGIVRRVFGNLGDQVKAGKVLAVIESRELADAKAEFLAARERLVLAEASSQRSEKLWQEKISAEKQYLETRNALAEAGIDLNSARQKLHALGLSDNYIQKLTSNSGANLTRFKIKAPLSGTIIEKHITLGETLKDDSNAFTIADLSTVWVDINVYQKDLARVRKGQEAVIEIGHGISAVTGEIAWVGPLMGETTRTAKARMVLSNPDGNLRPGQFVTAKVAVGSLSVGVRVPKTAIQTVDERPVIFVKTAEGFEPHPVKIGQESAGYVEVVSGLSEGQSYVSEGAFTLKAQLSKGAFGDGHNH